MKLITLAIVGSVLVSTVAYAAETLDADAVKKLMVGRTSIGSFRGGVVKTYLAVDGKAYRRLQDGRVVEGTWAVRDDGSICVDGGLQGGCGKLVRKDDNTYARLDPDGTERSILTSFVDGRDF